MILADTSSLDLASVIGSVMQGLTALAGFVLSWVVWRGTEKLAKVEYMRSLQESWSSANTALLENPGIARLSDQLFGKKRENLKDEFYQKRYLAFLYLNIIEASFLGFKSNLVSRSYYEEVSKDILVPMLSDKEVMEQIRKGGFSTEFVEFCEVEMKKQV